MYTCIYTYIYIYAVRFSFMLLLLLFFRVLRRPVVQIPRFKLGSNTIDPTFDVVTRRILQGVGLELQGSCSLAWTVSRIYRQRHGIYIYILEYYMCSECFTTTWFFMRHGTPSRRAIIWMCGGNPDDSNAQLRLSIGKRCDGHKKAHSKRYEACLREIRIYLLNCELTR